LDKTNNYKLRGVEKNTFAQFPLHDTFTCPSACFRRLSMFMQRSASLLKPCSLYLNWSEFRTFSSILHRHGLSANNWFLLKRFASTYRRVPIWMNTSHWTWCSCYCMSRYAWISMEYYQLSKFGKMRPSKPALTCKDRNQQIRFKSSSKRHYHSENTNKALTQLLGWQKILIKSKKLFNNKQIFLQQLWSRSNFSDCGHQLRLTWGINTLHAKPSKCEGMWSFTSRLVIRLYIRHAT
jgi:hypothetical protein